MDLHATAIQYTVHLSWVFAATAEWLAEPDHPLAFPMRSWDECFLSQLWVAPQPHQWELLASWQGIGGRWTAERECGSVGVCVCG